MQVSNIFSATPSQLQEELFEDIVSNKNIKIQRIVSQGDSTTTDQWYDQESDEWVIVLQGSAIIIFEDEEKVQLSLGEHIIIPAHMKHRVFWTSPNEKTVWIAVHY